jgi:hypothetical protein
MGYSKERHLVNCWVCGTHGLAETLAELFNVTIREAFHLLQQVKKERHIAEVKRSGKLVIPKGVGPLKKRHRDYLKGRNYNVKHIQSLFHIQGIGRATQLSWRIFIPIHLKSEIVSWTTRSITESHSYRYLSAGPLTEAVPHKDLLYAEEFARHAIIVTEGPLDVWRFGPGAVATFGTAFTHAQVLRMTKFPVRAVCFDNEKIAQKRAKRLVSMLAGFPGETYHIEIDSNDLGSATKKEIKRLRKLLQLT